MALHSLLSAQREILLDSAHLCGARLCLLSSTSFGLAALAQQPPLVQLAAPGTSHVTSQVMAAYTCLVLGSVGRETSLRR